MTDFENFYSLFILDQPEATINTLVSSLVRDNKFDFLRIQSNIYHRLKTLHLTLNAPESKTLQVAAITKALDDALLQSIA